ncbi:MAG: protease inhibitor I42 family protein [Actinobacteria bacterium]|nr:protease inhibitor I42 family protein [Actinomycetota bacterium]
MKHTKTAAIVIGAFAVALVLSLGGCAVNGGGKEYRDPSVPIVVEKGEEFTIALESNPTTGYRWMLQKELDEKIITLQKTEFEEPESNLLGAPGEERWIFKAVGLGRTTIELKYARPWEEESPSPALGEEEAGTAEEGGAAEGGATTHAGEAAGRSTGEAGGEATTDVETGSVEAGAEAETLVFSVWVKKKGATDKEPKEYDNPDEAIEVEEGLEFAIVLESNPTTGYQWQLAEPLDGEILSLVSATFESKGGGEGEERVGAPGEEVWTFEAVGPGKAEITLAYARPWEKEAAPEETKTFHVEVKAVGEEAAEH